VAPAIILPYNERGKMNYQKYTWVCTGDCDALIEYTIKDGYGWPAGVMDLTCRCGSNCTLLSVVDATIPSSTTTKEEPMIENALPELTAKIADLESKLQQADYWKAENGRIGSQLIDLVNSAYDNDADASEILESICEIIDYNPVKTIQFEGVIHFSGSMDVHRNELDSFDLTSALEDIYVDINNGDVVIDNYELYSVEEPY
jgi:hypothetical protein